MIAKLGKIQTILTMTYIGGWREVDDAVIGLCCHAPWVQPAKEGLSSSFLAVEGQIRRELPPSCFEKGLTCVQRLLQLCKHRKSWREEEQE